MESYYVIEFLARERQREIEKQALAEQKYNSVVSDEIKSFKSWIQNKLSYRKTECCSCC